MKLKVYEYKNCDTCRKAIKYLNGFKNLNVEQIPIREKPPNKKELKRMLSYVLDEKKLFNTSGLDYKSLNLKEKLQTMSQEDKIDLLSKNGNLVKRPFVLGEDFGLVGFKKEDWEKIMRKKK